MSRKGRWAWLLTFAGIIAAILSFVTDALSIASWISGLTPDRQSLLIVALYWLAVALISLGLGLGVTASVIEPLVDAAKDRRKRKEVLTAKVDRFNQLFPSATKRDRHLIGRLLAGQHLNLDHPSEYGPLVQEFVNLTATRRPDKFFLSSDDIDYYLELDESVSHVARKRLHEWVHQEQDTTAKNAGDDSDC